MKTSENKFYIYLTCTTKNNILILLELILIKSNHIWGEVKYKSESSEKEPEFENLLYLMLSDLELPLERDEITCR